LLLIAATIVVFFSVVVAAAALRPQFNFDLSVSSHFAFCNGIFNAPAMANYSLL